MASYVRVRVSFCSTKPKKGQLNKKKDQTEQAKTDITPDKPSSRMTPIKT
jgi:hypothetical protein